MTAEGSPSTVTSVAVVEASATSATSVAGAIAAATSTSAGPMLSTGGAGLVSSRWGVVVGVVAGVGAWASL